MPLSLNNVSCLPTPYCARLSSPLNYFLIPSFPQMCPPSPKTGQLRKWSAPSSNQFFSFLQSYPWWSDNRQLMWKAMQSINCHTYYPSRQRRTYKLTINLSNRNVTCKSFPKNPADLSISRGTLPYHSRFLGFLFC